MTLPEIKARIAAKSGFIEHVGQTIVETVGDYEKGFFVARFTTGADASNLIQAWYIKNVKTEDYSFQQQEPLTENDTDKLYNQLNNFINTKFYAGAVVRMEPAKGFAICEVFEASGTGVVKKNIIVKRVGTTVEVKEVL